MAKKKTTKKASGKKKAPAGKKRIEKRSIKKELWFTLTKDELLILGKQVFRLHIDKAKQENELKDISKKFKQKIGELDAEIAEKVNLGDAGKEFRDVACDEILDFGKAEVRYVFKGKTHVSRGMTDKEKQMSMTIKSRPIQSAVGANKPSLVPDPDAETQKSNEIKEVMNEETNKKTKNSAIDSVAKAHDKKSQAQSELSGGGA